VIPGVAGRLVFAMRGVMEPGRRHEFTRLLKRFSVWWSAVAIHRSVVGPMQGEHDHCSNVILASGSSTVANANWVRSTLAEAAWHMAFHVGVEMPGDRNVMLSQYG